MKKILIDTDILIDYSKGYDKELGELLAQQEKGTVELFLTPINIAEFFTDRHLQQSKSLMKAQEFINLFSIKEITKTDGVCAGELLRKKSMSFLGDALIAAVCVREHMELFTRNSKHYKGVKGLLLYKARG